MRQVRYKRLNLSDAFEDVDVSTRALSKSEVSEMLGAFMLTRDLEGARRHFEAALIADPDNDRALAGLGDTYKFEGR